ncbi:MAG: hypothetical protein QF441_01800 [Bacteriovoracaceae bacterium]|jgi:hypothetical protein|nr:hypothetical protein [Bacteriovoracaceae bacterium]
MKSIGLILFSICANIVFAGGGVDVGNGSSLVANYETRGVASELELRNHIKEQIRALKNKENFNFEYGIEAGECEDRSIEEVEIDEFYDVRKGKIIPVKRYKGIIHIKLQKCQRPYLIDGYLNFSE